MKIFLLAVLPGLLLIGCSKKSGSNSPPPGKDDSANVTVVNGYGSGRYKIGDTVDIWSNAIPADSVFNSWTGYNNLLNNSGEWHSTFVMPSSDLTLTASYLPITPVTLQYQQIRGINILKNVYFYFPPNTRGLVYLLHGTGGNAKNLVNNFEWQEMINDLSYAGYAVMVTEAEEVSLNTDINGDGKIRWDQVPLDSTTNPDYGNFIAIADTFYARGYLKPSVPLYSIGMSDGGAFSAALSYFLGYTAGLSYCAPASTVVTSSSITPLQFCMAKYDNASEVGPTGNATAQTNSQALTGRGICSPFFLHDHSRVYPQRFARWNGISTSVSASIFAELGANHWMDSRNYLTAASDTIAAHVMTNPGAYPVISSLSLPQYTFVTNELDVMYAAHQFFSDYNKTTIGFLTAPCH